MPVLDEPMQTLEAATAPELRGTVKEVRGLALRIAAMPAPIGAEIHLHPRNTKRRADPIPAQIVGFDRQDAIALPLAPTTGVCPGDHAVVHHPTQTAPVGTPLLGRVLNGKGQPIDALGPLRDTGQRPLDPQPIDPLTRPLIDQPLGTGVRAIDALTPLGKGQRIGVFAAPGVGKSTLLGSIAKHTAADVTVIALIGERGREVRDFLDKTLGEQGRARSVVVAATSDDPPLLRIRAAKTAATIAEHFRDQGLDVLLIMDSVTRFAQAQRQVGLASGEPPATRGFPPSVFALLPTLMERSGRTANGSITGVYSVLVEGNDFDEPVADACRGVLDGHLLLDRKLAEKGHYPAIDPLGSISRLAEDVTTHEHQLARQLVVQLLAAYRDVEDLLNIGAYAPGSNPEADLAIACKPAIDTLLKQGRGDQSLDFQTTAAQLGALAHHVQQAQQQITQPNRAATTPPQANRP
ncbi:MAG: FliI/YscN family ATPase [Planctomycetota bacterium]